MLNTSRLCCGLHDVAPVVELQTMLTHTRMESWAYMHHRKHRR